ncbi:MAG: NYN domain-containing protein [Phycisphaerales bacterium]|nr:NYN domain-containing protein [Phycisphaerales bacterium]
MADCIYVYVDGESHFIRSEYAWREIHGSEACLERLQYIGQKDRDMVLAIPKAKIFWIRTMSAGVRRATYFTSAVGDADFIYGINRKLRDFNVDSHVIVEKRDLADRRANTLKQSQIIEKPKGVDISIAVRMLDDSFASHFEVCHLYTSDVDFVPVIKSVRARGKQVFVYGYRDGLGPNSDLLTEPDYFVDLKENLRNDCEQISKSNSFGS